MIKVNWRSQLTYNKKKLAFYFSTITDHWPPPLNWTKAELPLALASISDFKVPGQIFTLFLQQKQKTMPDRPELLHKYNNLETWNAGSNSKIGMIQFKKQEYKPKLYCVVCTVTTVTVTVTVPVPSLSLIYLIFLYLLTHEWSHKSSKNQKQS